MLCLVSWYKDGQSLCFWDGTSWGTSEQAQFFEIQKKAETALRKVKGSPGKGFLKPNILDVAAYNRRFGKSLGPRPEIYKDVDVKLDRGTGILERTEIHVTKHR